MSDQCRGRQDPADTSQPIRSLSLRGELAECHLLGEAESLTTEFLGQRQTRVPGLVQLAIPLASNVDRFVFVQCPAMLTPSAGDVFLQPATCLLREFGSGSC